MLVLIFGRIKYFEKYGERKRYSIREKYELNLFVYI